jgi:hypothetical protein
MRSRAVRLTTTVAALIAVGVAGFFLFTTERQITAGRGAVRQFDLRAREAAVALSEWRAAQQAYVAAGQGVAFWMPRVEALQDEMGLQIDRLRAMASSSEARSALIEASARLNEFVTLDRQAREYIRSGETLMAGDVVFTESRQTAEAAAQLVETARQSEHLAADASEAGLRDRQATAIGGAAAFSALIMVVLALVPARARRQSEAGETAPGPAVRPTGDLTLRDSSPPSKSSVTALGASNPAVQNAKLASHPRGSVPLLKAAAELCTEFGRVTDVSDLPGLLARAADVMDASGVVVWLGSRSGADLRPVLAYGYPDHVLARMPAVARTADNAAAMAYRTGKLQIVLRKPGGANGAVVAPLLSSEGCVGALTAEILAGSEATDSVQALAALVAAQLTGVLAPSVLSSPAESSGNRIASA